MKVTSTLRILSLMLQGQSLKTAKQIVGDRRLAKALAAHNSAFEERQPRRPEVQSRPIFWGGLLSPRVRFAYNLTMITSDAKKTFLQRHDEALDHVYAQSLAQGDLDFRLIKPAFDLGGLKTDKDG